MVSKNDSKRIENYETLKAYIHHRDYLPDKHVVKNSALLLRAKYQAKKFKDEHRMTRNG